MTQDEARARVARGAAHLDRVRPGWERRIDVGTLTLWDPCGCVVGQLTGNSHFGIAKSDLGLNHDSVWLMGFDISSAEGWDLINESRQKKFGPLQDAWIAAIADRLVSTSAEGTTADAVAAPSQVSTG